MTNKYAIIENGIVVNMAVADAEFAAQQNWVAAPDHVDGKVVTMGWTYDGTNFVAPVIVEPVVNDAVLSEAIIEETIPSDATAPSTTT